MWVYDVGVGVYWAQGGQGGCYQFYIIICNRERYVIHDLTMLRLPDPSAHQPHTHNPHYQPLII